MSMPASDFSVLLCLRCVYVCGRERESERDALSVLQCVAVCWSVLQCVAVRCSVLHCMCVGEREGVKEMH